MAFFNDKLTDGRGNSRLMIIARGRDAPIRKLILPVDISGVSCKKIATVGGLPRTKDDHRSSGGSIDSRRLQGKEERCSSGRWEVGDMG